MADQPVTVTMPLELTAHMLREVRHDPNTSTDDRDEMNRRIGWLICAWDVLVQARPAQQEGGANG